MGYSNRIYQAARLEMQRRRSESENALAERCEEIYAKIPRMEQIKAELASCGVNAARAVLRGENASEQIEQLKIRSLDLQDEMKALLKKNGYPENYLEPAYNCPVCCDRGVYEDAEKNRTVVCECFHRLQVKLACEDLNRSSPLELSTFESFSLDKYSGAASNRMKRIYDFCKIYAKNFTEHSENLFMTGATGLGKTHLSLAIANEVIKKEYGVIYVSAPALISQLESAHFSYDFQQENETADSVTECDLLIIDDLATEFPSAYGKTTLYNIFNNRLLKKRSTIINTNLNFKELEEFYSQRFVSRLYGEFVKLDFIGRDIRVADKKESVKKNKPSL